MNSAELVKCKGGLVHPAIYLLSFSGELYYPVFTKEREGRQYAVRQWANTSNKNVDSELSYTINEISSRIVKGYGTRCLVKGTQSIRYLRSKDVANLIVKR